MCYIVWLKITIVNYIILYNGGDIMIKGIGTDIIEIERLNTLVDNIKFMSTYYTENENKYLFEHSNRAESAAAMFAAKESVSKAIGTGFVGFSPKDIEIVHNEKGKPEIVLLGKADIIAKRHGINKFHVSLSHCREYATAYVLAEGDE